MRRGLGTADAELRGMVGRVLNAATWQQQRSARRRRGPGSGSTRYDRDSGPRDW